MAGELFIAGDRVAVVIRGRRVLFSSWLWGPVPTRLAVDLPPEVGKIMSGEVNVAGLTLLDSEGRVFVLDLGNTRWTTLGEVREPDPPAQPVGPKPGERGVLCEPPVEGAPQPSIKCLALVSFCVWRGVDAVAGDEVLLAPERAIRLSRSGVVKILDTAAMRKAERAAERAAAAGRG